jgi:hypothetical protein
VFGLCASSASADASAEDLPAPHAPTLPRVDSREVVWKWGALRTLVFSVRMGARLVELAFIFSPCLVVGALAIPFEGLRRTFWDLMRRSCRWAGVATVLFVAPPP